RASGIAAGCVARRRLLRAARRASAAPCAVAAARARGGEAQAWRPARRGDDQSAVATRAAELLRGPHARATARARAARAAGALSRVRPGRGEVRERARAAGRRRRASCRHPLRAARLRDRRETMSHVSCGFVTNASPTRAVFAGRLDAIGAGGGFPVFTCETR